MSLADRARSQRRKNAIALACIVIGFTLALVGIGSAFVFTTLPDLPKPEPIAQPAQPRTGPAHIQTTHAPDTLRAEKKQ